MQSNKLIVILLMALSLSSCKSSDVADLPTLHPVLLGVNAQKQLFKSEVTDLGGYPKKFSYGPWVPVTDVSELSGTWAIGSGDKAAFESFEELHPATN